MIEEFEPKLRSYQDLLFEWNSKVNLVSRRLEHADLWSHIQHCLTIVAGHTFPAGARIVDWGTGGGLPAIPLAIVQPEVTITAVDSTLKKVNAVNDMARALGLTNVRAEHARAESWHGKTDYSVSRATASLAKLWSWHRRATRGLRRGAGDEQAANVEQAAEYWRRGLIALKGGDLAGEVADLTKQFPHVTVTQTALDAILGPEYKDKYLVFVRKDTARIDA